MKVAMRLNLRQQFSPVPRWWKFPDDLLNLALDKRAYFPSDLGKGEGKSVAVETNHG